MTLPRGRGVGWFGLAGLVNALGTGFFYPFQLLFFRSVLGLPLAVVGAGLTVATLAALPAVFQVGRLVDRVGPRPVLIGAALLRGGAFVGYVRADGVAAFLALSVLVAVCQRAEQTATPVLAAAVAPPGQVGQWLALAKVVFNAGIGGGALLASLVLVATPGGFTALGLVNAVSFAGAALLYLPLRGWTRATAPRRGPGGAARPWRNPLFLHVTAANFVLLTVIVSAEVGLPVYLVDVLDAPSWTVGLLFAVNTALMVLLQIPVSGRLRDRRPLPVVALGVALHGGLPLALGVAAGLPFGSQLALLLLGMVAYTFGEIVATQTLAVLLVSLPPERERGSYQAFNQVLVGLSLGLAPLLVTAVLVRSPVALWWILLATVAVAAADVLALQRRSGRLVAEAVR